MDDDLTREADIDRVDARTSARVAKMSDKEREQLSRELARRRRATADAQPPKSSYLRPPAKAPAQVERDHAAEVAAARARLTAELHSTERRLERLERNASPGRYGGGAPHDARYDRLLSRADRLERKLRDLG